MTAARPSAMTMTTVITTDGGVDFHATTDDPEKLAQRFARVIRTLVEQPTAIACAAGFHGAEHAD